jgi:DMSO/TMAO reductase YedYZ molybdopterin-dependent catalytic subunit
MALDRRGFLKRAAGGLIATGGGLLIPRLAGADAKVSMGPPALPPGALESSLLDALPGKRPLIKRSFRPPNYETPLSVLGEMLTPNDAFFVRWHLANIPTMKAEKWRLRVGGDSAATGFELDLEQLKKGFPPAEVVAVCQCSGNRRGLSDPHVPGVQWGYGGMGNARWKGARLKDVLAKAGVKKGALEVAFNAPDVGVLDQVPDFIKSIPLWKAMDENTLLAYEMNGAPLPHWNGHPVRLVVPGWTATYWMKQVTTVDVIAQPQKGFWMEKAYRIPLGKFPQTVRFFSQESPGVDTTPITEMVVNSLVTNLAGGEHFALGRPIEVKGIAWDSGYGIHRVGITVDGGATWKDAKLGPDQGNYSWRQWSFELQPARKGTQSIMVSATNRAASTQTTKLVWNPAGYHHNVVQKLDIEVD